MKRWGVDVVLIETGMTTTGNIFSNLFSTIHLFFVNERIILKGRQIALIFSQFYLFFNKEIEKSSSNLFSP